MRSNEIEEKSMRIIEEEAKGLKDSYNEQEWVIVRRVIHTTADFDFASKNRILFHKDAISNAFKAISSKAMLVADTDIIYAALNKKNLNDLGLRCICKISDPDVISNAKAMNKTRAEMAMILAKDYIDDGIVIIGNAPTALLQLLKMVDDGIKPMLIIATPVGFVNAEESKEMLLSYDIPYITNVGRKGGSTVAASIFNALMLLYKDFLKKC